MYLNGCSRNGICRSSFTMGLRPHSRHLLFFQSKPHQLCAFSSPKIESISAVDLSPTGGRYLRHLSASRSALITFDEYETPLCVTRQLGVGSLRLRTAKLLCFLRGEPRQSTIAG